ncbi:hypothetical protein MUGA111182_05180 [Mucilaginibacter galii]|uniref:Capsule assembly Wzi family protein n=1 Tax=Mucilaginibacter galii TaxID=2005073 RepID=A0A917J717_9SPHI|nr:hypothetical protein [Mucilaginibacter galii]GGI49854.1 hypothetical protein GCM10011425_10660 [Mucilaginibacter galii]
MKTYIIFLITLLSTTIALAQHDHMQMDSAAHSEHRKKMNPPDSRHRLIPKQEQTDTTQMMMSSQLSRDLPMSRNGSGTSWVPDETPVYGYMVHGKKWMSMVHGNVFARYTKQDLFNKGTRGGSEFDAPNWLMGMTQRKVGRNGLFSANAMISLDPLLVGLDGYPLLYQTGESYKGQKLVDRQHPHDLFAELNISYAQRIAPNTDVYVSVGYPAEPALGPPVFMHRLSATNNPDAPLQHHYADATHITFGVATLGFRYKDLKIEGSTFKGREPDEERYGFDAPKFDSYAMRLSYNPSKNWALQVSHGWIKSPEALEPQANVKLFTASAMYAKRLAEDSHFNATLVYGQNHYSNNGKTLPGLVFESNLQLHKTALYGSYTYVRKDAHELDFHIFPSDPNFNIQAATVGANRILTTVKNTDLRVGAQATLNFSPQMLQPFYGRMPVGFEVYIRISPSLMKMMGGHQHKAGMDMSGMNM